MGQWPVWGTSRHKDSELIQFKINETDKKSRWPGFEHVTLRTKQVQINDLTNWGTSLLDWLFSRISTRGASWIFETLDQSRKLHYSGNLKNNISCFFFFVRNPPVSLLMHSFIFYLSTPKTGFCSVIICCNSKNVSYFIIWQWFI